MSDATTTPEATGPDLHKAIVRIVAGGIGEGVDRLMAVARSLEESEEPSDTTGPFTADPTLMAIVGWASEFPEFVRGVGDSASRMTYPITRVTGVALETAMYLAEITGVKAFVADLAEPAVRAWNEERERLTSVGTAEYARGRVLAAEAFERSVEGIVGLLSESDELADLVREQTLGVTGAAVQEIRETGAAADSLTEGIFRRILRREVRPIPPRPDEAE